MNNYPVSTPEEMSTLIQRNKENGWPDLDIRAKGFAHAYIVSYDHREAAVEAGYHISRGTKLLRDPLIAAYIAFLQEMQQTSSIITRDFINTQYLRLYDMAIGDEPINHVLPDGEEITVRKTHIGDSISILREMSKSTDYAKENVQSKGSVRVNIDFGGLFGPGDGPVPNIEMDADVIEGEIDE